MTAFDDALALVIQHEKGFVNDPDDRGGPTNFGLTLHDLEEYYGHPCAIQTLKNLRPEEVSAIYRRLFWDEIGLDQIQSELLAAVIFDQGVLNGPVSMVTRLQTVLGLHPDGVIGPLTASAINRESPEVLAFRFIRSCQHHLSSIVAANPRQLKYLGGWSDRLYSLLDYVFFGDAA